MRLRSWGQACLCSAPPMLRSGSSAPESGSGWLRYRSGASFGAYQRPERAGRVRLAARGARVSSWRETDARNESWWRPPVGVSSRELGVEQDRAAGGRPARMLRRAGGGYATASVSLTSSRRRVYARLIWIEGSVQRRIHLGEVDTADRRAALREAWSWVRSRGLLGAEPLSLVEDPAPPVAVRASRRARRPEQPPASR